MTDPSKIIPVITEARLAELEWKCECGASAHGGECEACGAPHPRGMVVIPDGSEGQEIIDRLTSPRRCGDCRHFDLRAGQEAVNDFKDPLYLKLVREMKLRSLTDRIDWKELGLCRYWTGGREQRSWVCKTSPARVNRGRLDSSAPRRHRDDSLPCPAYRATRGGDGRVVESYRQVPGARTRGSE